MKLRISRALLVAAVALLFASSSYSQTVSVRAQVPFPFVVGNHTYPAGEYTVKTLGFGSYLTCLQNRDERKTAMTVTHPVGSIIKVKNTVLLFHRMGGTYFLYQVWAEDSWVGLQFHHSPVEQELAMNTAKAETVSIAANSTGIEMNRPR